MPVASSCEGRFGLFALGVDLVEPVLGDRSGLSPQGAMVLPGLRVYWRLGRWRERRVQPGWSVFGCDVAGVGHDWYSLLTPGLAHCCCCVR